MNRDSYRSNAHHDCFLLSAPRSQHFSIDDSIRFTPKAKIASLISVRAMTPRLNSSAVF